MKYTAVVKCYVTTEEVKEFIIEADNEFDAIHKLDGVAEDHFGVDADYDLWDIYEAKE